MSKAEEKSASRRPILRGVAVAVIATVISSVPVWAQDPYVYPTKGQSNDKMDQDKHACYQWAKGQTGFDPMQAPTATAPAPEKKGGVLKGAAGGALAGVAIGAIAGDAGKGAAIGAASGGLIGGARRRQSTKAQEAHAQQQSDDYSNRRNEYNRAWGACLEGKGYTVK
jgi:predicted lipid-binding transport protein (Tim44 family)